MHVRGHLRKPVCVPLLDATCVARCLVGSLWYAVLALMRGASQASSCLLPTGAAQVLFALIVLDVRGECLQCVFSFSFVKPKPPW